MIRRMTMRMIRRISEQYLYYLQDSTSNWLVSYLDLYLKKVLHHKR